MQIYEPTHQLRNPCREKKTGVRKNDKRKLS